MKIITDGNKACSRIAYLFTEIASIYPITPSSPMAAHIDEWVNKDRYNLFNAKPSLIEMQSEAGAAGAMHGALLSGSLATTFTSSQGLLLMLPNMYKMAGELLPGVIHVAARSIATHALSIFGDHQDIYAARATGFAMLASTNVSDAQNLAAVAHLSAIESSIPFLHFFDGFRTSHELNTIEKLDELEVLKLVNHDKIKSFKNRVLNLNSTVQYGMAQNEDIYFQNTEARNTEYLNTPDIVNDYMQKINSIMNTDYKPFNYYGNPNAKHVIVAMGSVCDTIKSVIDNTDEELGLIEVHLYRPFSTKYLLNVLPQSVVNIAVLDRTKEHGSNGEPLYLDIVNALKDTNINIVGGRYGLSSKNTDPNDIYDVFNMLQTNLKNNFTIGITDDVTHLSLEDIDFEIKENSTNIKIFGFGSDGMVGASHQLLKLIHKKEDLYVQGYFEYDSKKSGGITVSHLRIDEKPINLPYYVKYNDLVVVTKTEYLKNLRIIKEIKANGSLLINLHKDKTLNEFLTKEDVNYLLEKNINVFTIDADKIAYDHNLQGKISMIMQTVITTLLKKDYASDIKHSITKIFKIKGEDVVQNNLNSILNLEEKLIKIDMETIVSNYEKKPYSTIFDDMRNRKGNDLKVSQLLPFKDGKFPYNLTKDEKRNITDYVPKWTKENCIQCNQCSFVCPHAVIRPFITDEEDDNSIVLLNNPKYNYKIVVSEEDCTGCGLCVKVCPGKSGLKALSMMKKTTTENLKELFENHENPTVMDKFSLKGSQFEKPLFEFSGACAGCGETPYIKLLTQLYGKNIVIANATGCSSIYGGSAPSTAYKLPWANSLFEDNAEFALGMHLSYKSKRDRIKNIIINSLESVDEEVKKIFEELLNNFDDFEMTLKLKEELENKLIPNDLKDLIEDIPARRVWGIGGDGWAYDIGYGGLDHVLHTNENIKFLILDTEVYSNTGGQASKSTRTGAVAEFADNGKKTHKKDLFKQLMSIPNVYVASISIGANPMQAVKVFKEAEEHQGPSVIIAYSPCIEHGIKGGLTCSLNNQKLAVESGYLLLMRYMNEKLYIDSKEPDFDKYFDYLNTENRFNSLYIKNKEEAEKLFKEQKEISIKRYKYYEKLKNVE